MKNNDKPEISVDEESAELIACGDDSFYQTLNPGLYPSREDTLTKKKKITRRPANPAHYQRFLTEALPLANTGFDQETHRKDALMRMHFPRQYEVQGIRNYDPVKKGATFAHLVRAAQDIVGKSRR